MNADETTRMVAAIAKLYARSGLFDLGDLLQEGQLAVLETRATLEAGAKKPDSLKAYLRLCIHNHFRDLSRRNGFEQNMLSLDEEIGKDDDGESVSRIDLLGVDAGQEDAVSMREKKELQTRVAENRVKAVQKEGAKYGKTSRIEEMLRLRASGMTEKEIGHQLGVSQQAVSKTLRKVHSKAA